MRGNQAGPFRLYSLLCRISLVAFCLLCLSVIAAPAAEQGLWEREKLTGDWGGVRSSLRDRGIEIGVNYIGETLRISSGGLQRGTSYEGRLELHVDHDLEKLVGWTGARTHVRGFQIHKGRFNAVDLVGSIGDPSNIDAVPTTRLFTAWFQQDFGKAGSITAGLLAADEAFLVGRTAGGLINATFGWAPVVGANMPGGGPAYPLAAPGVRLQLNATENVSIQAAVLSGHPGGKDCNDLNPQICNKHGTTVSFQDGALWAFSVDYEVNRDKDSKGLAAAYKIGGWYHTGNKFADQRYGIAPGGAIVTMATSPDRLYHGNDWGLFAVIDQMLWRSGEKSVSVFTRGGFSPADRNLVSWYVDGGIGFKGLFAGRPDDTLTFGAAYSKISKDAVALDWDTLFLNGPSSYPIRSSEAVFEASYIVQLAPWWSVQPDIQYIRRPGGNVPFPDDQTRAVRSAWIVGARSTINF